MDILGYTYDAGNKLVKVTDTGNATYGFKDSANLTTEYIYDVNGNMKTDANKGITDVQYNYLNLPTQVSFGTTKNISYIYDASGTKLKKVVNDNGTITTTDYAGNFIYENNVLQFFSQPEGYVEPSGSGGFNYVYQYKDHLGNIRLSYTDINQNNANPVSLQIKEENNYYPFGLKHKGYNNNINGTHHKYMFGGKELSEDLGLNTYDFGARNYDAAIGRWMNLDPLADLRYELTPYNYVQNSPMFRIDPDGLSDFKINRETGAMELVKETDDKTDRVIKTYSRKSKRGEVKYKKNGDARTAFGGVEKGILSAGINFQEDDNVIAIGGEGGPSVEGVKSFTLKLSEHIGKEIKGFSYSSDGSGNVTDMLLGNYADNDYTHSSASVGEFRSKYGVNFSLNNIIQQFHTHPDGKLGATATATELSGDITNLQKDKPFISNATFIILFRINGQVKPGEYPYTHEYRKKKK